MSSKTFIHLHTLDLRVHDSPSLHLSHDPSSKLASSISHFLPVYIFDERQLNLSELPDAHSPRPATADKKGDRQVKERYDPQNTRSAPLSRVAGFHRTSPYRLKFLLEAVYGLRDTYRRSGGDMLIGYGKPEVLVPALVKQLQENGSVAGVWAQREYSLEEANVLDRLDDKLPEGIDVNLVESKTLISTDNLPFTVTTQTPDVYTTFRKKVEGMGLTLEEGGMLQEPLQTAKWETEGKSARGLVVSVGSNGTGLKAFPKVEGLKNESGSGWITKDSDIDSIEGLYTKLSKTLFDNPPLGGWASEARQGHLPKLNQQSAIPFAGSEEAALSRLEDYVGHASGNGWSGGEKAKTYKDTRNGLIGNGFSTKFASFLSLGCLSPKEAGWRVGELLQLVNKNKDQRNNVYWIIFELLWRDYFQFITHRYASEKPSSLFDTLGFSNQISTYPKDARPNPDDWHTPKLEDKEDKARRWCEGRTGVPFIDAPMIELRETGYMSNRSRQNVASFLTKDLYVDWRVGAEFFEMHLVDYDTCSNWGNWQYQAGVGNDPRASRQFNPIKQANDYDRQGEYVRLWLPQLAPLQQQLTHTPWLAPNPVDDYPSKPIVELQQWKKHYQSNSSGGGGHGGRGGGGRGGGGFGGGRGRGGHSGRGGRRGNGRQDH